MTESNTKMASQGLTSADSLETTGAETPADALGVTKRMQQSSLNVFQDSDCYPEQRRYRNPDWLRDQYWGEGKSMRALADIEDVTARTIEVWMDKHGIDTRRAGRPTEGDTTPLKNETWLTRRYWYDMMSAREVADHLGVTYFAVLDWMQRHNIERRHCGAWSPNPRDRLDYGPGWNRDVKETVRDRDGRECVDCSLSDGEHNDEYGCSLHVHHIIPARTASNPAVYNAPRNLVTLCASCHEYREKDEGGP
jgi:transposase